MKILTPVIGVLLVFASACSNEATVDLPDYLNQIENLTVFTPDEVSQRVELVREASFGNPDEVIIGRISDIVADDQGRVFIYDSQQIAIHVFNADGSWLGNVGRQGDGPGEFQRPSSIEIKSNRLYVEDLGSTRMSIYSLDTLEPIETILLERPDISHIDELNGLRWRGVFPRSDGSFLVRYGNQFSPYNPDAERPLLYYAIENGEILPNRLLRQEFEDIFLTDPTDPVNNFSLFGFTPGAKFTLGADDRMYSSQSVDFLINIHDKDGNHLYSFYYPIVKRPINRDEMVNYFSNDMHKRMIRDYDLYETWPAIRTILVDDEERIWVSTYGETDDEDIWWVLENTGERAGTFHWPRNQQFFDIQGGYAYARETNDEGLATVGKYAINILPSIAYD